MSYFVLVTAYSLSGEVSEEQMLGSPEELRSKISAVFPDTDWSDPSYGDSEEVGLSFSLITPENAVDSVSLLSVRVGGSADDPFEAILKLCNYYSWYATDEEGGELDLETGELVYPDNNAEDEP